MKSYKDDSPSNSVKRIKAILDKYDIITTSSKFSKGDLCFSSRIEIALPGIEKLHIGTNGKGMNEEYSLASGYAECMERIQNKMLLFEALKYGSLAEGHNFDFRFFPDEKIEVVSHDEFLNIVDTFFPNYKIRRLSDKVPSKINLLTVPFFDVHNKSIVDVPIEIARANSTTGMCAGNTSAEAIVQGINEILERYVLQVIYKSEFTPADIPEIEFEGTVILERLRKLRQEGIDFVIKDCSLGLDFPVVGLLLFNKETHSWTFRLGADSDAIVALERCFTEIYQGMRSSEYVFSKFEYDANIDTPKEYAKSLKNGTGKPPLSLLGKRPSYPLRRNLFQRADSQALELKRLIEVLNKSHYNVYIRDNSFMGFPTYQILIPGLSDQFYQLKDIASDYVSLLINPNKVYPLYHIKSLGEDDNRSIYSKIVNADFPLDLVHLFPYCLSKKSYMAKSLLLFMLAVRDLDYTKALIHLTDYLNYRKDKGVRKDDYLLCLKDYIDMKSKGADDDFIHNCLSSFYDKSDLSSIIEGFSKPLKIFDNYDIPDCFNCSSCSLKTECLYHQVLCFEDKLQDIQKSAIINQQNLSDIIF